MLNAPFSCLKAVILVSFIFLLLSATACSFSKTTASANRENLKNFPPVILWAWERPEDLRFIDSNKVGAAFLAQTLFLQNDEVIFRPRRQPLQVNPETFLIAVTRIETSKKKS